MPTRPNENLAKLRAALDALIDETGQAVLSGQTRKALEKELKSVADDLDDLVARLDPVGQPTGFFDPGNPRLMGRFVALALIAQDRQSLAAPVRSYGSGVYAIYYNGDFPLYRPLSRTETPIYVGQAAPSNASAQTPAQQGPALHKRLVDHRRSVSGVTTTLALEDFECRSLVVHSGWETPAEDYLIELFQPIWNKEMKLVYGIGKHGDLATTRAHPRSPWHTLHPGREWADQQAGDTKTVEQIKVELAQHFESHPPFRDSDAVLHSFFEGLRQA